MKPLVLDAYHFLGIEWGNVHGVVMAGLRERFYDLAPERHNLIGAIDFQGGVNRMTLY